MISKLDALRMTWVVRRAFFAFTVRKNFVIIKRDNSTFWEVLHMQKNILQELVQGIRAVVNDKLVSIILYGSVARGTETAESDVDIAIIINGKLDEAMEDALSDVIVDMNLKYDKVFSVVDIDEEELAKWGKVLPYFRNVKNEGIVLWKAA